jgi:hypothetical protein
MVVRGRSLFKSGAIRLWQSLSCWSMRFAVGCLKPYVTSQVATMGVRRDKAVHPINILIQKELSRAVSHIWMHFPPLEFVCRYRLSWLSFVFYSKFKVFPSKCNFFKYYLHFSGIFLLLETFK